MRRVGLLFLSVGLAGFLVASAQRARHPGVDGWESGRWLFIGMAVMGAVFVAFPGEKRT